MNKSNRSNIRLAAVILCGGRSRRMGRDKASLPFGTETILQREVRILRDLVERIVLVAAHDQSLEKLLTSARGDDIIVAQDRAPDRGPLEGIAVGLSALPPEMDCAFVTSCDAPLLAGEFVLALFRQLGTHDAVVPFDEQFTYPLAAVYRARVGAVAMALVDQGERRPRAVLDRVAALQVPTEQLRVFDPPLHSLMNLNRPDDYRSALEAAGEPLPNWLVD